MAILNVFNLSNAYSYGKPNCLIFSSISHVAHFVEQFNFCLGSNLLGSLYSITLVADLNQSSTNGDSQADRQSQININ